MSVDRRKLKWDGPPSQKVALIAIYLGHLGVLIGVLGAAAWGRGPLVAICVGGAAVMYFAAFFVERRERRRERL